MNKSLIIFVALATVVLLSADGAAARRLRTNPNRGRYSTAAPSPAEEAAAAAPPVPAAVEKSEDRISVDPLETAKFSFSDSSSSSLLEKFKHTPLESDRKSFGPNSGANVHFSDVGTSISSFGKGLRKRKPSYQISEESEEEASLNLSNASQDAASYEVNYKTAVTHKPGPSFDSGSFKFGTSFNSAPAPAAHKTPKFGAGSNKFGSFNSPSSGLFKFNEPAAIPSLSGSPAPAGHGQITTKFAISHPAPTHTAANLGGSYQTTYSEEGFGGGSSGQLNEKFISDFQSTLNKYKTSEPKKEKPKTTYQSTSSFKSSKFPELGSSNFKVSSDFKVGSESQFPKSHTKFGADFDSFDAEFNAFKPNFKLQDVPNLYPSEETFRPSLGFPGSNKLFEPNSSGDSEDFLQKQLAKNPASKGQYQQYLKSQEDEKIEQQALLEQLKYQQSQKPKAPPKAAISRPPPSFSGASGKFRPGPYITVKKNFNRRKPLIRVKSGPGLSHYRTPVIDGPYTIHFSV